MKTQILLFLILFQFHASFSQLCPRPDTVHIAFGFCVQDRTVVLEKESANEDYYIFNYSNNRTERFIRTSVKEEILKEDFENIYFFDPIELRQKELMIRKCEIKESENRGIIYLDLDVNSIFKNIVIIERENNKYLTFKVKWADPIE